MASSSTSNLFIDLHRHLDGNVRPSTILELALKHKIALDFSTIEEIEEYVYIKDKTDNLLEFLQKLDLGVSVIGSLDDCERIAYENVEDAIKQGLAHTELRFSPYYMAMTSDLPMQGVVEAVINGVTRANKAFHYDARLIGILSRTFGSEQCMSELDALLKYSNDLVAVDLAGDEKGFPARDFTAHFNKVKDHGLNITIHAGEADGPQSIWDAIKLLHAQRIGHGVAAIQDRVLMDYMAENDVGVEVCLLSNYQTGAWLDLPNHPVKHFLDVGMSAFLNTDDPGVSNNTLQSEYRLAVEQLSLNALQLDTLQNNALEQCFLSNEERSTVLQKHNTKSF